MKRIYKILAASLATAALVASAEWAATSSTTFQLLHDANSRAYSGLQATPNGGAATPFFRRLADEYNRAMPESL